jgi:hypothetical protein
LNASDGEFQFGGPDLGIGYARAVDVAQGDLCGWSCETHATGLAHLGPQEYGAMSRLPNNSYFS